MVRAIRSRKLISHSNGSIYPFEKNHQLFERLELPIREIHQPFKWLKLSVREIHQPFEWLKLSVPEIHQPFEQLELSVQERNNEFFWEPFQTIRHALLNDACCYVYITQTVVTFLFFVYLHLILNKIVSFSQLFPRKKLKKNTHVMFFC